MFSHTLLEPDEKRVLAGGVGYNKHTLLFSVLRLMLQQVPAMCQK